MFDKLFYYISIEGYNVLEEHHDAFKNELSINSFHVKGMTIHKDAPIDVLYKSNPTKEVFYLTYLYQYHSEEGTPTYLRLNIDGIENIEIECDDSLFETLGDIKRGHSYRAYFEITKEQLYKLCLANSLAVQISNRQDFAIKEFTANGLITILQTLYNRVVDNAAFCDAGERAVSYYKDAVARKKAIDKEKSDRKKTEEKASILNNNKELGYLMLFGGLIVLLIGILACCAVPYSGFGILCIIGGALIAIFSLVPFLQ